MLKKYLFIYTFILFNTIGWMQKPIVPMSYSLSINGQYNQPRDSSTYYRTYFSEIFKDEEGKRAGHSFNKTKLNTTQLNDLYLRFITDLKQSKKAKNYNHVVLTYVPQIRLNEKSVDSLIAGKGFVMNRDLFIYSNYEETTWKKNLGSAKKGGIILGENSILLKEQGAKNKVNYIPLEIDGLEFNETWNFDPQAGSFSKNILFAGISSLNASLPNNNQKLLLANNPSSSVNHESDLFVKNVMYDILFDLNCDPWGMDLNCSDLFNLTTVGTCNNPFIGLNNKEQLILDVFSAIKNGSIIPIKAETFIPGEKEERLTESDVYKIFETQDTTITFYEYPPYDPYEIVVTSYQPLNSIIGIGFVEDWYIQPIDFTFYKKVKYFSLLCTNYDRVTGEIHGYHPVFYLKTKE